MASNLIAIHRLEYPTGTTHAPGAMVKGVDRRTARAWVSRRAARRVTAEDRARLAQASGVSVDLTQSVGDVLAAVEGYDADQLRQVLALETAGKARKTLLAGIEERIADIEAPDAA